MSLCGMISGDVECHGRLESPDIRGFTRICVNSAVTPASICHKFRNTVAGFWFRASKVPASPSHTVTISAAATTPAALPACQMKLRVISRVTISQAATEPAITPKMAVAKPIIRYSSA